MGKLLLRVAHSRCGLFRSTQSTVCLREVTNGSRGQYSCSDRFNELMRQYWRTGDTALFEEVLAPDYVQHWPGFPSDRKGYLERLNVFRAAFPDLRKTTEDLIASEDKVIDRVTVRATHTGEFMGFPPTGKSVEITEMHIARIVNGRIVERWGEWDLFGLLEQIGGLQVTPSLVGRL